MCTNLNCRHKLNLPSALKVPRAWDWLARAVLQLGLLGSGLGLLAQIPNLPPLWHAGGELGVVMLSLWLCNGLEHHPRTLISLLGNHQGWCDFGWGMLIGIMPLGLLGLSALTGVVRLELRPTVDWLGLGGLIIQFLAVSAAEEIARAYPLQQARAAPPGWQLSSAFVLASVSASLFNQDVSAYWPFIVLDIVLYGLCYWWTGRVALALAHHWAVDVVFYGLVNISLWMDLPLTTPALFDLHPNSPLLVWTPTLITFAVVFAVGYLSSCTFGLWWWAKKHRH